MQPHLPHSFPSHQFQRGNYIFLSEGSQFFRNSFSYTLSSFGWSYHPSFYTVLALTPLCALPGAKVGQPAMRSCWLGQALPREHRAPKLQMGYFLYPWHLLMRWFARKEVARGHLSTTTGEQGRSLSYPSWLQLGVLTSTHLILFFYLIKVTMVFSVMKLRISKGHITNKEALTLPHILHLTSKSIFLCFCSSVSQTEDS